MNRQRPRDDESLIDQLRSDAARITTQPSAAFRSNVMRSVSQCTGSTRSAAVPQRWRIGRHSARTRALAAAAMVVIAVVAWLFAMSPSQPGHTRHSPQAQADPSIIQPWRDQAPSVSLDVEEPFRSEARRLLADAGTAAQTIIDQIPFQGRATPFGSIE